MMQSGMNQETVIKAAVGYLQAVSKALGVPVLWKTIRAYNAYSIPVENLDHCSPFCRRIKAHTSLLRKCVAMHRSELLPTDPANRVPRLRRCHAGVYEMVVTVPGEHRPIGILYAGPWRMESLSCGVRGLEKEYLDLPVYDEEKGETASRLLELIANQIVSSRIDDDRNDAAGFGDRRIQQVKALVKRAYGRCIPVEEMASTACLSKSRFLHLFKETEGMSYGAYCRKVRMEFAGNLLVGTGLSVTEISNMAGYQDPNNFSSAFRAFAGMSPTQFRKTQRNHTGAKGRHSGE